MNRRSLLTRLFAAAALATGLGALAPAPALAQEAPDALIQRLSTEVLERIRADKALQSGDVRRISQFVDQVIMPHVNFQRMTALSVGQGWRQASPEQKKQLMAEFRTLLVRTYAGALAQAGDVSVKMKPFRAEPGATEVIVRTEVQRPRGEPIQLDYRLEQASPDWKIYDLNVLGVWLVANYRAQFAQQVQAGGIDGLIRTLAERNRAGDAAKG